MKKNTISVILIILASIIFGFVLVKNSLGVIDTDSIIITSPKEGDVLYLDKTYTIKWKPPETFGNVIILLTQDRQVVTSLDMRTENSGSYTWILTREDYRVGDNYRLKITAFGNNQIYGYSGFFTIKNKPDIEIPEITINVVEVLLIIIAIIVLFVAYDFSKNKKIQKIFKKLKKK